MLPALLAIGLGTLLAAALAAYTGTPADGLEAGAVALLIGVLGAGMLDDLRESVVVRRASGGHDESDSDQDIPQRFNAAG